jgi:vacuolar-type H+-ATPase subunit C/Vma6
VIQVYLRKYDILTLKRMLRAKKSGEEVEDLLLPVGGISSEKLEELSGKNFEELRGSIEFRDSEIDYRGYLKGKDSLAEIEAALDQAYYDELMEMASGNSVLEKFVRKEVEYENLKIALRLKRYEMPREDIEERLLTARNGKMVDEILERDFDEALKFVISELSLDVDEEIEAVEHAIEVHRLESALRMLHTQPLSLGSILGYVVAKITEVKNLRMLLRAKETGIQNQETIRRQLVLSN